MRIWRRRPAAPAVAIVSLGLAVAAATAAYAVVDAALWRPLPVPEPERLVWISSVDRGEPGATSPGVFSTWLTRTRTLSAVGAIRAAERTVRDDAGSDRLSGAQVTEGVLRAVGGGMALGRTLTAADMAGAPSVIVISHRLWQERYGGDPAIIGRQLSLDGDAVTIVGVLAPAFDALPVSYSWLAPLPLSARDEARVGARYLDVLGRLVASRTEAEGELAALSHEAGAVGHTGVPLTVRVERLQQHFGAAPSRVLVPLFVCVLALLVIAVANALNLLLTSGRQRHGELAIRTALGASRWRLAGQLAVEATLIAAGAGVLALLAAQWLIEPLSGLLPSGLAAIPRFDLRAALFAAAATLTVAGGIGLVPAWRSSRVDLRGTLSAAAPSMMAGGDRVRRGFVAAQIAVAISLVSAALLMLTTTRALYQVPRGYRGTGVITAGVALPSSAFPRGDDLRAAIERLAASAASGAEGAAIATRAPLSGGAPGSDVAIDSQPFSPGVDRQTRIRFVTPGYFGTVGTPLLEGRDIGAADSASAPPVVLVNDTLARRLSPDRPVVGRSLRFDVSDFNPGGARRWRIVGHVADARDRGPRQPPEPEVYVAVAQGPPDVFDWIGRTVVLCVRPSMAAPLTADGLRRIVQAAAPAAALFDVQTLDARLARHLAPERALAAVLTPLALVGVILAAVGLLAVAANAVAVRRRELALRIVLGASPRGVVFGVLRDGWAVTAAGAAAGLAGAVGVQRLLASLIFGASALQPAAIAVALALVVVLTTAAAWWPARRAAALDPATVLRDA